ncbi:hypothetical protein GGS26DRAFT_307005 [Hypomontagnella submonticulosa]|nr:hypothetical protein GGS26DRAFT_307005 [Hypomontagnella submonticulosa]
MLSSLLSNIFQVCVVILRAKTDGKTVINTIIHTQEFIVGLKTHGRTIQTSRPRRYGGKEACSLFGMHGHNHNRLKVSGS